jgi:hypothetical protein
MSVEQPGKKSDDFDPFKASQEADWDNFRDHLTTTDKRGRIVSGFTRKSRTANGPSAAPG